MAETARAYPHRMLISEMKRVRLELERGNLENVDPDYYEALREEVVKRIAVGVQMSVDHEAARRFKVRVRGHRREVR